jgi:hypothetical protein
LIKTLRDGEKEKFSSIIDWYIDHIVASKNQSLLARIYGIFTFETNYFKKLDVILMENTSRTQRKAQMYDLKGSLFNRWSTSKVLKDMNFLEKKPQINLCSTMSDEIIKSLKSDSTFLASHGIMDYSLLLCIEKCKSRGLLGKVNSSEFATLSRNQFLAADGKSIIHVGIIDYM